MVDGKFHVKRRLDGSVLLRLTPHEFVVSPMHAVQIARSILKEAGVEVVMADPGQTVIRPPSPSEMLERLKSPVRRRAG